MDLLKGIDNIYKELELIFDLLERLYINQTFQFELYYKLRSMNHR
jgi:hypothetical protein